MTNPSIRNNGSSSTPFNQNKMTLPGRLNLLAGLGLFLAGYLYGTVQNDASDIDYSSQHQRQLTASPKFLAKQFSTTRTVHVGSMCRCGSNALPVRAPLSEIGVDTTIVQPPSKATGQFHSKRFIMHPPSVEGDEAGCTCIQDHEYAETTNDMFLKRLDRRCPNPLYEPKYDYNVMPDLGVEEKLPIFVGVLSYKSPLSLNGTLHNWRKNGLFPRINAQENVFVQLNKRSEADDDVMDSFQEQLESDGQPPLTVMGSPEENLHPGLAISKFCRAAEAHPNSHPNGENLLLFLEKDWNLYKMNGVDKADRLEEYFRSINALQQRGVPFVRLAPHSKETDQTKMWKCPSEGVHWMCTTAHQHRWSNQPSVISCSWFLRYLEPFALLEDPIMSGCRAGFQENHYCDWEEALQDGRVAWTESQWVVATFERPPIPRMFIHKEVDQ